MLKHKARPWPLLPPAPPLHLGWPASLMCCPESVLTGCSCLYREFSKPLLPVGRAGVLLSEILHLLCRQMVSANSVRETFWSHGGNGSDRIALGFGAQVFPFLFDRRRRVWWLPGLSEMHLPFCSNNSGKNYPITIRMDSCGSKQSQATCYLCLKFCLLLEQN